MTKQELIEKLKALKIDEDVEFSHQEADNLLIEFINDIEIQEAYNDLYKWYA
jgi:hypothetical protein